MAPGIYRQVSNLTAIAVKGAGIFAIAYVYKHSDQALYIGVGIGLILFFGVG